LIGREFALINLCVAFGFFVIYQIGAFGSTVAERAGVWGQLSWLTEPFFAVPDIGLYVNGITGIAIALALLTIVFFESHFVTNQGAAVVIYASLFYGSIFLTGVTVIANFSYPGVEMFYSAYILLGSIIFINDLVQMNTGGQKAFK